jgi:DNA replication protein DnaC
MELDADGRERYLQSIVNDEDLSEWQECYTPTTLEGRKPPPKQKFSSRLKLKVESVKPAEKEALEASNPGQREQVEQLDVLEGLRKYAPEHVLLVGKPGSGKSTSLEWLLWNEASSLSSLF